MVDERPNVLVVCNAFQLPIPSGSGGIETLRVQLTLRYRSIKPVVLTDVPDTSRGLLPLPVEIHRIPLSGSGPLSQLRSRLVQRGTNHMLDRAVSMLIPALRLCRRYNVRCIECGNSNLGFVGYLVNRLLGIPYVVHVNSSEDQVVSGRYGRFSGPISRAVFRQAAAVVVNSHSIQSYVQKWIGDPTKVHAVRMGVDPSRFSPACGKPPADIEQQLRDRPVMLSVSRLVERKGSDTVIRALPAIVKVVPNILYVIVGRGPDRDRLERLASSLNVQNHVLFSGERHNDELVSLYRSCNLFLLISRFHEGMPLGPLEAAACGRPVVVGDRGGQTETVMHNVSGYVVPSESAEHVAEACISILSNPDKESQMGQAARRMASSMSWDIASKAVEEILLSVLNDA